MKGVNKVILIGSVGQDPEIRYTQSNVAIANLSIATSEKWKDKQTGEAKEVTEWHRCVAYRKTAEIIGEYVKKGSSLFIEGRLATRKWRDKNGVDRYTTEIIINEMQMLGSKKEYQAKPEPEKEQSQPEPFIPDADFDDAIPF